MVPTAPKNIIFTKLQFEVSAPPQRLPKNRKGAAEVVGGGGG